jgi:hypothetical protein
MWGVGLKTSEKECRDDRKVINTMTAKVIALEQCVEDIQKKVFPQVGGKWPNILIVV